MGSDGRKPKQKKLWLTRTQARARLQVSLADFSRLCILKGVYPHEPPKGQPKNRTYYHIDDIKMLASEEVLAAFRKIKSFAKRLSTLKNRREQSRADSLERQRPYYSIAHVIRERFPTVDDALEQLDDAITMINLFSLIPTSSIFPSDRVANCSRLSAEWRGYCAATGCLKKAFLTVKGVYFQAVVRGHDITWVVPYQFPIQGLADVDLRIMGTFVELYEAQLNTVLARLYKEAGLSYPPESSAASGMSLPPTDEGDRILDGTVFFINREVPRDIFSFLLRCMGASVGWEEMGLDVDTRTITHQVIDRPLTSPVVGRVYIQPQWIVDSLNAGEALDSAPYLPEAELPPHRSPFTTGVSLADLGIRARDDGEQDEGKEAIPRRRTASEQEHEVPDSDEEEGEGKAELSEEMQDARAATMPRKDRKQYKWMKKKVQELHDQEDVKRTREEYHKTKRARTKAPSEQ